MEEIANIEDILTGKGEKEKDALEAMIDLLSTPIARRKGVIISAEDCKIWVTELTDFRKKIFGLLEN